MPRNDIIKARNVHKSYGKVKALSGVDITVPEGIIFGLLGPNGAGKTTLIRILTTLIQADQGEVFIKGINLKEDPEKVRDIIGLAGQYAAVDEHLTAKENLSMFGNLYHIPSKKLKQKIDELLVAFDLVEANNRPLKTFSGGMRRRLDLAVSLIAEPEIVFLDEPTTGLDPRSRNDLWTIIKGLVDKGTTVLLTTQYLEEADYLAQSVVVIDKGKVIAEGTSAELKKRAGKEFIEIHVENENDWEKSLDVIKELNIEAETNKMEGMQIIMKTSNLSKDILKILNAFESKKIEINDLDTRKPTLDDVFLMLTK